MKRATLLFFMFGFVVAVLQPATAADSKHLTLYTTKNDFDSVKQDLEIAITGRGLVVDHTSHISEMLERTGKDLGIAAKPIYGKAESLQFCSAVVSRHTMEADPSNIVFCPYIIVIYTLPSDPKKVYVGYREPLPAGSPASRKALGEVKTLLDGIVREALGMP
ncbi:MAG: DUF302 domain-containing protein [Gammaproteobacteria bacterium]|nr:DUF302 domain-containing protein [Gammaproteobacteria bacterium]